jgi:hypothetical protein
MMLPMRSFIASAGGARVATRAASRIVLMAVAMTIPVRSRAVGPAGPDSAGQAGRPDQQDGGEAQEAADYRGDGQR